MQVKPSILSALAALALSFFSTTQAEPKSAPLKVCSAENEMPYSNKDEQGFENRIARLIADELGRPLQHVWWKDPRYYVRDLLDKGLCDVTIGLDTGDPRVLTTESYYRSGYVFVTRKQDNAEADLKTRGWSSKVLRTADRIAFIPGTPAEVMMRKQGLYNDQFNYMHALVGFKSRRNQYVKYETEKLVSEVESGNADVAVLWGPAAARYVNAAHGALVMTVIPDDNQRADGRAVSHHFSTSMGVRKDDHPLLTHLNRVLKKRRAAIQAILTQEGIPLLKEGDDHHA